MDYFNTREACHYLQRHGVQISTWTLRRHCRLTTGPIYYERGTRMYFRPTDLDNWIMSWRRDRPAERKADPAWINAKSQDLADAIGGAR